MSYDYEGNIHSAIFHRRLNRFVAEVELDGKMVLAHVKNTGRLPELLVEGALCYLQESKSLVRKTKYDLLTIEYMGNLVNLDSQVSNKVVQRAFEQGLIEGWEGIDRIENEVSVGNSRLDLRVQKGERILYVEVKGVNLVLPGGHARFPDAPTQRGTKHLRELIQLVQQGYQAMVLFLIMREDAVDFAPNGKMDPAFAEAFYEARDSGVDIRIYDTKILPASVCFHNPVPLAGRENRM
ncbi:MAG: DNA/RNA nuclease SfsA [Tissierellia bacterium]|nr:DNA/RNA nuclease SfsA [Tissierellia bacterium]